MSRKDIIEANAFMLRRDDSHLWPISGKFNATKRCIRRLRYLMRMGLVVDSPLEYTTILEDMISAVVNSPYALSGVIQWEEMGY